MPNWPRWPVGPAHLALSANTGSTGHAWVISWAWDAVLASLLAPPPLNQSHSLESDGHGELKYCLSFYKKQKIQRGMETLTTHSSPTPNHRCGLHLMLSSFSRSTLSSCSSSFYGPWLVLCSGPSNLLHLFIFGESLCFTGDMWRGLSNIAVGECVSLGGRTAFGRVRWWSKQSAR